MHLFGIKPGALIPLERVAGVTHERKRIGYTGEELNRLNAALNRVME